VGWGGVGWDGVGWGGVGWGGESLLPDFSLVWTKDELQGMVSNLGPGIGSRQSSVGGTMESQKAGQNQHGHHAASHSFASNLSSGGGLDDAVMRELDQVPPPPPHPHHPIPTYPNPPYPTPLPPTYPTPLCALLIFLGQRFSY
jgi:hypothetical protein